DHVSVTYVRDGREHNTSVELKNINGTTSIIKNQTGTLVLGASLRSLTAEEKKKLGINSGVLVTDIKTGLISQQTNMRKGFVILSINDQPVSSSNDVEQVLSKTTTAQIGGFYPG